jgi:hypothetical protein
VTDCEHRVITTYAYDDGGPADVAMWACADCRLRFAPRTEVEALRKLERSDDMKQWWETQAVRAALHAAAGRCRDGVFEHCYDRYHTPPIQVFEWWPALPPTAEGVEL